MKSGKIKNQLDRFYDYFIKSFCLLCISIFTISAFPNYKFFKISLLTITGVTYSLLLICSFLLVDKLRKRNIKTLETLSIISLVVSFIRISALYLAKMFQNKPGLLWNVDNGLALTHANTIARYGSLENSLSFAGKSESYHAGPSYIAGLASKYLTIDIGLIIILLIPILTFSIYIISSYLIIKKFKLNRDLISLLIIFLCIIPGMFLGDLPIESLKQMLINPILFTKKILYTLPYGFSLMQNSMFAGSAIIGIIYLVIDDLKKNSILIYMTCLSLSTIKPLYFISIYIILLAYIITALLTKEKNNIIKEIKELINSKKLFFIIIFTMLWYFIYTNKITPFYDLNISFRYFNVSNLWHIQLYPVKTGIKNISLISTLIFGMCIYCKIKKEKLALFELDFSIICHLISVIVTIISLQLPLAYEVKNIDNSLLGTELGINPNQFGQYFVTEWQAAYPIAVVSIIFGMYAIISSKTFSLSNQKKSNLRIFNISIILTLIVNIIHTNLLIFRSNYVRDFDEGDEVNESELIEVLKSIPINGSRVLSNTVLEGYYGRKYRNTYLTSFTRHEFYLSNLIDYHWRSQNNAYYRYDNYNKIFPSNLNNIGILNPNSINIIKKENITHIILKNNRNIDFPKYKGLKLIKKNNKWAAYKVE